MRVRRYAHGRLLDDRGVAVGRHQFLSALSVPVARRAEGERCWTELFEGVCGCGSVMDGLPC